MHGVLLYHKVLQGARMARTSTTSIRLDETLASRLDDAAAKLHRRKNGIIVRAIEEYLERHTDDLLRDEARRQSLLASRYQADAETDDWETAHDQSDWQA